MSASPESAPPNPYAAPEAPVGEAPTADPGSLAAAEAVRRAHLTFESNVQVVGGLHTLVGVCGTLAILVGVGVAVVSGQFWVSFVPGMTLRWLGFGAFALGNAALGFGLNRFQPWARWVEAGFAGLVLLSQAILTVAFVTARSTSGLGALLFTEGLVGASLVFTLHLMLSAKGGTVFSPEYREVVARTPHVRAEAGCLLLLLFFALCALVTLMVFSVLMLA